MVEGLARIKIIRIGWRTQSQLFKIVAYFAKQRPLNCTPILQRKLTSSSNVTEPLAIARRCRTDLALEQTAKERRFLIANGIGQLQLMEALGVTDTEFLGHILHDVANIAETGYGNTEAAMKFIVSQVKDIQPRDKVEIMLAVS